MRMADALKQRGEGGCSLVDEGLLVTVEHFIAHGRDDGICLAGDMRFTSQGK